MAATEPNGAGDMEREHEEAMRTDYTTYAELGRQMHRPSTNEAEIQLIDLQQQIVADRWETGPHANHWGYLDGAHEGWRADPELMQRRLHGMEYAEGNGYEPGLTDVELRSQEQARDLAAQARPRSRSRIERSR